MNRSEPFWRRHIGPSEEDVREMVGSLGYPTLEALTDAVLPNHIRQSSPLTLRGLSEEALSESEMFEQLQAIAKQNKIYRSLIGMGYAESILPPVIQRNIFENPNWYTPYTPYQAEIAQGHLEALLNFQTMIADLTALPIANASLLDEATAAAEAMGMCSSVSGGQRHGFFVAENCHPQVINVLRTRAQAQHIALHVGPVESIDFKQQDLCGILLPYPTTDGHLEIHRELVERSHQSGALVVAAADLLALTLFVPPGEWGADIAIGSSQRFGIPLGFGGPHAAYLSCSSELARKLPGRLIGVSKDAQGKPAYRLAIQTREQHIRRDKATSNICTAQGLLAIMASFYAIFHGPEGLTNIARRIYTLTSVLARGLKKIGHDVGHRPFFDTLRVTLNSRLTTEKVLSAAVAHRINLRRYDDGSIGITLDERTTAEEVSLLLTLFQGETPMEWNADELPSALRRTTPFLTHPVFQRYRSEHELTRYIHRLQSRDVSLTTSMIPLGSCTMKLNATSELMAVTWPEFSRLHPYAPSDQTQGYTALIAQLEGWLKEITGMSAVSFQPNAGSQGELSGLLAIRRYHETRGESQRNICLISVSAHGTNAASAAIAGLRVIAVKCDQRGNVDIEDLEAKAQEHASRLAAVIITYPSTHGVFEERVKDICAVAHAHGGMVYLDGANLNALVGLSRPIDLGVDICHLNLHKTFCIPHGGGGPGVGPIAAAEHLKTFLPGHPLTGTGAVCSTPHGSASILPISWAYIALMGGRGLTRATQVAILNANYMAKRLSRDYAIVYTGKNNLVAHEFIIDCRPFEKSANVRVEDIAKRLIDFGFHAPTMSWPVPGTLMIEPTESESRVELDRYCDALMTIRQEIRAIEKGEMDRDDNPLKNAPHTAGVVTANEWRHPYSREQAAYPTPWQREHKYWPSVGRIDNAYGDRVLVCSCPPVEDEA